MQDTQSESETSRRVGVEEKFINFRPSPNFKKMKKFLKSKFDFDYTEGSNQSACDSPDPVPTVSGAETKKDETPIYPPLPLDPPPPDDPTKIKPGTEEEVQKGVPTADTTTAAPTKVENENDKDNENNKSKKRICKDFIRGTCTRAPCKFAHKYDITQLQGVYIFCHNYQNTVCTYPNCKFVHATVFEEAEFYRTGILPPHVIAQQKQKKKFFSPLPSPAQENSEGRPPSVNLSEPPPSFPGAIKPLTTCIPAARASPIEDTDMKAKFAKTASLVKPMWGDRENFGESSRLSDNNSKNKCSNCVLMENRYRHTKTKVETMIKSLKMVRQKNKILEVKEKRLNEVFNFLSRQMAGLPGEIQNLSELPPNGGAGLANLPTNGQLTTILNNLGRPSV